MRFVDLNKYICLNKKNNLLYKYYEMLETCKQFIRIVVKAAEEKLGAEYNKRE